ncbi:YciI family protein [Xanthomonas theicola]|uniref:YCII-related domain-containing protein n=1 Tax=Xanthomonas theicola TaxID=56464 RepID=A0A2S6ZDD0_9XANT|nr:hypothetical protein [Xanthomonas theicola]PPT89207.1 hypothetical protein XthCFBP4691_13890 [Xanthomonas theicola]QNH25363.1 hypothetical protein G4Q83_12295 [Xanthomonas theicola]
MTLYLVLAMRKPDFPAAVVRPHRDFLAQLRERGLLELAGGFGDGSGGAYLLKNLDSLDAARALVATDPLAIQQASVLTVHEWNAQ